MAMKIGEILIQKGVITEQQLKEALDAQLIYGGHLGTCLFELGHIDEQLLGELLAAALHVNHAPGRLFQDIAQNVLDTVPQRLVEKHKVVPFELKDKTLHVAMIDPRDLQVIDELRFASGHAIQPWLAPEVRIIQAAERYYDIPRSRRYIALSRKLEVRTADRKRRPASLGSDATRTSAATTTGLEAVGDLLCNADTKEMLADAVLNHTEESLAHSVLFVVKDGSASIWRSRGLLLSRQKAEAVSFPIISEPIFKPLKDASHYRGPIDDDARYRGFYEALGIDLPAEALILPVRIKERIVSLFYGDAGKEKKIPGEDDDYLRLMAKFALGLNLISLKKKIRSA